MKNFYQQAHTWLQEKNDFAFAVVLQQEGSTPRGPGAKMIITEELSLGSIGGGGVEGKVIQIAREALQREDQSNQILNFDLSPEESSGLHACGGRTLIGLFIPDPTRDLAPFSYAAKAEQGGKGGFMVFSTQKNPEGSGFYSATEDWVAGDFQGIANMKPSLFPKERIWNNKGIQYVVDPIPQRHVVHLFGGGHVSLAVSKLLPDLDFASVVYEDRAEFANEKRFPETKIILLEDFHAIPEQTYEDTDHLLILTRGHQFDKDVLAWALPRAKGYVGMIGSKSKCKTIFDALRVEGFSQDAIDSVHAPIGLPIGGDTPEEIAISIVAELVQWRWQHGKRSSL